jgi:hypothetical protein
VADGDEETQPGSDLPTLEPDDGTRVVRRGGRLRWIAAFVGAVGVIAGLVVVLGQDDEIDADEALEQAQEFVESTESYRFELLEKRRITVGDPEGAGSDTTTRYLTTGSVADADHWHVVEEDGYEELTYETVRVGDTGYSNDGFFLDEDEDVDAPRWTTGPIGGRPTVADIAEMYAGYPEEFNDPDSDDYDPQYAAEQQLDLAMVGYLLPVSDDPAHVKRLVADAEDPVVEEELADGGVRLRAQLAPVPEIVEASKQPIPPVDLVLDLDEARRPTVARFTAAVEGASQDVELRYLDWDKDVAVTPPPDADIDHTPWLPEETLAAHPELLVAPTRLPEGWALAGVNSYSSGGVLSVGGEELDCRTVDLMYATPQEMSFDYEAATEEEAAAFYETLGVLSVSIATEECLAQEGFHTAQVYGPPGGEEQTTRSVVVEGVVVNITSTLDEVALDDIERSVRRVTVEELAAMFPPDIAEHFGGPFFLGGPFG